MMPHHIYGMVIVIVVVAAAFSGYLISITSLVCVSASTRPGPDVMGTSLHALLAFEHEAQAAKLQPFPGRGCPAFHGWFQIHTRLGFNADRSSLRERKTCKTGVCRMRCQQSAF